MGEVYRARDPRLNRDVAIKVSAAQFTERFEREAQAIAALNHPNICQIYDVGASPTGFGYFRREEFTPRSRGIASGVMYR
jgi:serine/threonine protein kinase